MSTILTDKLLQLEGTYNARELGGYESQHGGKIKKGKLLRSDGLHQLSSSDESYLLDYGIRTIIDLRSKREFETYPDTLKDHEQIKYHSVPFLDQMLANNGELIVQHSLKDVYVQLLEESKKDIQCVIEIISKSLNDGVLFHCAAGKDRTGIIAMLLLSICEVKRDIIIQDYSWSAELMEPRFVQQKQELREVGVDVPAFIFESNPSDARETLHFLDKSYGGPIAYLKEIGVTRETMDHIYYQLLGGDQ